MPFRRSGSESLSDGLFASTASAPASTAAAAATSTWLARPQPTLRRRGSPGGSASSSAAAVPRFGASFGSHASLARVRAGRGFFGIKVSRLQGRRRCLASRSGCFLFAAL